jgi:serine/threonine protein kinase/Tol biopolymer transport system component
MSLKPNDLLNNRYRILSILGQGGMGAVYRAEDENLGRHVAVKENLFLTDEYSRQFRHEAFILSGIRHPSLPHVSDYFSLPNQGQYIIMDFIEGEDLRHRIERNRDLPETEVVLIGAAICDALDYLHNRTPSIIHRDIKPGNIKVTPEGEIVLVDFGLAKLMSANQTTATGARAMTPGYSPPEQYGTARTDVRSDIYALGATLYTALTGVIPEDGFDRVTGRTELTPIKKYLPDVTPELADTIEKALQLDPQDRFQNSTDFKKELLKSVKLERLLDQTKITLTPPPPNEKDPVESEPVIEKRFGVKYSPPHVEKKRNGGVWALPILIVLATLALVVFALTQPSFSTFFPKTPTLKSTQAEIAVLHTETSLIETKISTETVTPTPTVPATDVPQPTPSVTDTPEPTKVIPVAPGEPTPFGGGFSQIAFVSKRTGNSQIWLMNADGTKQHQLTDVEEGACQPDWSPDGKQMVFIAPCKTKKDSFLFDNSKLYILDLEKDKITQLPIPEAQGGDFDPAWSPDGNKIAFTSLRTGIAHVFVYNLVENTINEISDTSNMDIQPAWRPGGKQISVSRFQNFSYHLWLLSDKGQSQFQFSSNGNLYDLWAQWSSDGEFAIFSRTGTDTLFPYLVSLKYEDRASAREKKIPPFNETDPGPIVRARLSPDAKWVSFESWPDGRNHDIFIMDIAGKNITRLTTDPSVDYSPVWRPYSLLPQ